MTSGSRRDFLRISAAVTVGFQGLRRFCRAQDREPPSPGQHGGLSAGYGPLLPDPQGILDLPRGFSYKIISQVGSPMDDGLLVPGKHDGMATFPGPDGLTLLVRNHECENDTPEVSAFGRSYELLARVPPEKCYDDAQRRPPLGGTTTLLYDTKSQRLVKHYLSLAGTLRNCAGGPTPWGSWITCEETEQQACERFAKDHGYTFEVPARAEIGLVDPIPLTAMGRFRHEAMAVDPHSGAAYETEDMDDGLIYRFLPNTRGAFARGGRLQALALRETPSRDTRNWKQCPDPIPVGRSCDVDWIDMEGTDSPHNDLRQRGFEQGAARFARSEGMWYGRDAVYFACTTGGLREWGQIWRYVPSRVEGTPDEKDEPGRLELFLEPNDTRLLQNADNVTVAPWGDLVLCEDHTGPQRIMGVTPAGQSYLLARNPRAHSEFAGATFSPDGTTLFVNIQQAGMTMAIWGPWQPTS